MNRLLIVDDEVDSVKYLARALEGKGLKTSIIETGQEAIEAYEKDKFDFVLLDLFLKKMKGWQVLEAMKEKDAKVRVFMITAEVDSECLEKAKSLGAKGFVSKPLDADKIRDLASRFLEWDDEQNKDFIFMGG